MTRCLIISILIGDIMGQMKPLFVVLIFSCATLSGCIFSSALTIFLAKGYSLIESLKKSKKFINKQIDRSPKLNVKYGPLI